MTIISNLPCTGIQDDGTRTGTINDYPTATLKGSGPFNGRYHSVRSSGIVLKGRIRTINERSAIGV